MTRPFEVHPMEQAYVRRTLFGIELLDAVNLTRVSAGVRVVAEGLQGTPIVNASGMFVWLDEDFARLRKVTIEPGLLPYERVELAPGQVRQGSLTTIELPPRANYPFTAGITGMRGVLIEGPVPVGDAEVHLRWLDENGLWRDAPTISRTDARGDFTSVLRFSPAHVPLLDAGAVTVRLRARRPAGVRESDDRKLPQGRVADPSTFPQGPSALIFAWDQLHP